MTKKKSIPTINLIVRNTQRKNQMAALCAITIVGGTLAGLAVIKKNHAVIHVSQQTANPATQLDLIWTSSALALSTHVEPVEFSPFEIAKAPHSGAKATVQTLASLSQVDQLENKLKTQNFTSQDFSWKRVGQDKIEVSLATDLFFQKGSAYFEAKVENQLRNFIQQLSDQKDSLQITIESHTDDTPVVKHRKTYQSNWGLSAARAGAVAEIFQESQFPKAHLEAIGLADSRPLSSNRDDNRRIVLIIQENINNGRSGT